MSQNETPAAEHKNIQEELVRVNPHELDLGKNVRENPEYEDYAHLIPSIKANGMYHPILGHRNDEGDTITVIDGQCRVLAAREIGLPDVLVLLQPHTDKTLAAREADRIIEQIETTRRRSLTDMQVVRGMQELFKTRAVKNADVSARLGLSDKEVTKYRKLTKSDTAIEAMEDNQLSMEEALIIAEFEGNDEALARLARASRGNVQYTAARIRNEAKERAEYAEAAKPYTDAGFTVLDIDDDPDNDEGYVLSEDLVNQADGEPVTQEQIDANPAHWSVQLWRDWAYVHIKSGEVVETDVIDWHAKADETAGEDLVHNNLVDHRRIWFASFYSTDPQSAGVQLAAHAEPESSEAPSSNGDTEAPDAVSPEEKQRRERRKLRELNKLGLAAEQVRREWVKSNLLAGKTAPKGAIMFIAAQITRHTDLLEKNRAAQTARVLLGYKDSDHLGIGNELSGLAAGAEGRATVLLLGQVLGALEEFTPKDTWREPEGYYARNYSRDYLQYLAGHGYPLTDIERVVLGEVDGEDLYEQVAAELAEAKASKAAKKKAVADVGEDGNTDSDASETTANVA
ncbi:transcriptional regulator [Mycobacteroides abscessus subsp. massiliense]|uniref:ParB/RepB/Spo0J family partition protein n=1 Tax=Mycobacteroides abscessus TaxID=36809 RepID=UPI0009A715C8|nr:ParB/RepB/Spo0J family partition protein [Mycobacteroides abscessus]SLE99925.1 transcriptional regulator [Mycobacteroides abscessus subsp. massiliense]